MYSDVPPRITQIVFWLDSMAAAGSAPGQPFTPVPGIMALCAELAESFEVGLILDGDEPTFAEPADAGLYDRVLSDKRVIRLNDLTWDGTYKGLHEQMARHTFIKPGVCLLVDGHPLRSMAAIRAGLDSTIFVDVKRLRRDLWLWRIVDSYD